MYVARQKVSTQGYGKLFEVRKAESVTQRGKRFVEEALVVLERRLPRNELLRRLPLTEKQVEVLTREGFAFLKKYNAGSFEKDNLSHVQRLVVSIKKYSDDLETYLGLDYKEVQLLAALHDLGKSLANDEMLQYLSSIYGEKDFISLRVIPHELFSMYWIQKLCVQNSIDEDTIDTLMDQISNHNFGPDLNLPENRSLLEADANGTMKHWWLDHWKVWSAKANRNGMKVSEKYGHVVSPLATTLVLFDRVDGGELESWEKYLNQDLLSGSVQLSPATVIETIRSCSLAAKDQIIAVGRQLKRNFIAEKLRLDQFRPYADSLKMQTRNEEIADRFVESNEEKAFKKMKVDSKSALLYRSRNDQWFRIDGFTTHRETGRKFLWRNDRWNEIDQNDSPVELLMELIYSEKDA